MLGLDPLQSGNIELGGRSLVGIPTHKRRIGVVFQEPRLFPNLSVIENVAFPLRAAAIDSRARRERAQELLQEVGLAGFEERRPATLSGGEQQRVALARALCGDPDLLLLDEPLASVDPNRREELRGLVARLQRDRRTTTLYVTHDRAEAAELGHDVAVMFDGIIEQQGPARELFERPRSERAARFFGSANLLRAQVSGNWARCGTLSFPVDAPDGEAVFVIRPEQIRISPTGSSTLRVEDATYMGTYVHLGLRRGSFVLEAHIATEDTPAVGTDVCVELPPERLWRLPPDDSG